MVSGFRKYFSIDGSRTRPVHENSQPPVDSRELLECPLAGNPTVNVDMEERKEKMYTSP